jgi:type III restriction enzyme
MPVTASWITHRPHPDGVEACIRNTNVNVWGLVQRRRHGLNDAQILDSIPGLTPADLDAAWAYYAENRQEIEAAIARNTEA